MSDVSKGWIWNMKRQTQDTVILLGLVTREEMASMAGLLGSSQAVFEGSIQLSGSRSLSVASNNRVNVARPGFGVRAQQVSFENETRRCVVLGLVAVGLGVGSFAKDGLAAATSIKVGPPPPTSGGLPGTENSDEARDLDIQLKKHFYMQPLPPTEVAEGKRIQPRIF